MPSLAKGKVGGFGLYYRPERVHGQQIFLDLRISVKETSDSSSSVWLLGGTVVFYGGLIFGNNITTLKHWVVEGLYKDSCQVICSWDKIWFHNKRGKLFYI